MRRLTAVLIVFFLAINAIAPPPAQAIAPWVAGLGKFLLGWAAGKVLDYALDAVLGDLSEGGDAATVPSEYRELKQECARLREAAWEASQVLKDLQHRTEFLEERAQVQDAFHGQAAHALREINTRLISVRFLSDLPSRLEHIRETHDRKAAEQLGKELMQLSGDIAYKDGLDAFLRELIAFAKNTTSAIQELDRRQARDNRELLAFMNRHENEMRQVNSDVERQRETLEAHTKALDEIEKKFQIIFAMFAEHEAQENIAEGVRFASQPINVVEIRNNYSSIESLQFLLDLRTTLADCGLPVVAAPFFSNGKVQVRGTLSYTISCYRNPLFHACDWSFTLSKDGRNVLAQSEQNRGYAPTDVRMVVQNHIANAVKEKNVCALLR